MKFNSELFRKEVATKRVVRLGISLDEAAKASGVSKATLSRLERGAPPDIFTFGTICQWLKISPNKFFN